MFHRAVSTSSRGVRRQASVCKLTWVPRITGSFYLMPPGSKPTRHALVPLQQLSGYGLHYDKIMYGAVETTRGVRSPYLRKHNVTSQQEMFHDHVLSHAKILVCGILVKNVCLEAFVSKTSRASHIVCTTAQGSNRERYYRGGVRGSWTTLHGHLGGRIGGRGASMG